MAASRHQENDRMRTTWLASLVLVLAGGVSLGADPPVKLGVAGPKTGAQAKNGQDLIEGTTLAVEEWNAKGGVLGRKIEIVVRDDEAQDKNATVVAGELVDAGVAGVVGHFNSGCTIPASNVYKEAGIPMITPASTNVKVTDRKFPNVFRICGRDDQQGKTAADHVADVLKLKKVAVLDDRTAYGKGLADAFEKSLGGRVEVVLHDGFDKETTNFRPYLTRIKEKGAELIYFGGIYDQGVPLVQQAREAGLAVPFMSGDGVHGYQKEFIEPLGAAAEGTFTTFPDTESAPGFAEFTKKYKARFGAEPGPYAIYSYASALILLDAIAKAGSTEPAAVCAAVHAGTFPTPVGDIDFDERGDVKTSGYYHVWVIKGGKHVLVK
jgi:branched-chain amino acid transport system substrate-binding protein